MPAFAGDPTAPLDLVDAYSWIWSGEGAPQQGVAAGTIDAKRLALVHGQVLDAADAPLGDVRVEVAAHPEFGHTTTDADGKWTLAVNGGSALTVRMSQPGRASAQRQVTAGWREQLALEPVVLVKRSARTNAAVSNAATTQVLQGDASTDGDGIRRSVLVVPAGTTATAVLPGGAQQALPTFTVRATEFTIGERGPQRMPADFAANIAYTYCVEHVCDEAEALGAVSVRFSKPLVHYVDNFLGFPVGSAVPTGFYDAERAAWVPVDNGTVVRVLDVVDGRAMLDVSGNGTGATAAQLTALGIDDAERAALASAHGAGAELWRVPIDHFTPWDHNWPFGPPAGATPPRLGAPGNGWTFDAPDDSPNVVCGSIVLAQDQVLVEEVDLPGTGMRLVYRSDRAAGFESKTRVPLTGDTVPPGIVRVEFVAQVGGRRYTKSFAPAPNLAHEFVWDGRDRWGRLLQGRQRISISIGYAYPAEYQEPAQFQSSFGQFSGVPMTANQARQDITLWQHVRGFVGTYDARGLGLGGWMLDAQHVYDAEARMLLRGDGTTETRRSKGDAIETFAGQPLTPGYAGDGGPAQQALLQAPSDVCTGADGALYVLESAGWLPVGAAHSALRRIGLDGTITTIAGGGASGWSGDGGPAANARLREPRQFDIALDGSIWIADTGNHCIRRIGSDGTITTVAGVPMQAGFTGDGGSATSAKLRSPAGIAVARDGSVYVSDMDNNRIRRIGTDGRITTIAGTGVSASSGDEGPAIAASLHHPGSLAVDDAGNVYVVDNRGSVIRRIGIDGIIHRHGGTGGSGTIGDGGSAVDAHLATATGIHVALDGALLVTEYGRGRVRRIGTDGIITTIAGTIPGFLGDNGRAADARLRGPMAVCQSPDGSVFVADSWNHVVRRIGSPWEGFGVDEKIVVDNDGTLLHVFDRRGRHLRTESAMTTEHLVDFVHDQNNRLIRVQRESGITTITRNPDGDAASIVAPSGKATALVVDAHRLLQRVQFPDGRAMEFTYSPAGLLSKIRFADGTEQTFEYDATGRLVRDTDPTGRALSLAQSADASSTVVDVTTTVGRSQRFQTMAGATAEEELRIASTCCEHTEASRWPDGTTEAREQNGLRVRQSLQDDPVFGAAVRSAGSIDVSVPGVGIDTGPDLSVQIQHSVTPAGIRDPRAVETSTSTVVVGSRPWSQDFDRAVRTIRWTTPSGRSVLQRLDDRLRIVGVEAPGEPPTSIVYDAQGRVAAVRQTSGSVQRETTFQYDADGILVASTGPNGDTFEFVRDSNGRPIELRTNGVAAAAMGYGPSGFLTSVTPPGKSAHSMGHDAVGRLVSYTPPGGAPVVLTRDPDGLVTSIDLAGEQSVSFLRESGATRVDGLVVGAPRVPGTIAIVRDSATGMLTSATTPEGVATAFTYHGPFPHTAQTTLPGTTPPQVTYVFNSQLELSSVSIGGQVFPHAYDEDGLLVGVQVEDLVRDPASGRLVGRSVGNIAVLHDYDNDGFSEVDRIEAVFSGSPLFSNSYSRDAAGRITQRVESTGITTSYGYDARGRLTTVHANGVLQHDLRFDENGNPTQDLATGRVFTCDAQDRLLQAGNVAFGYDAAGRLRSRTQNGTTTSLTYDVFGNLLRVEKPGTTVDYLVDAFNQRLQRRVNGVLRNSWVRGADGRLLAESRDGGPWRTYGYGTSSIVPDFLRDGSAVYVFVRDQLGSVRRVVHSTTGVVVQSIDYDAWGNVVSDTNPGFQPFGFAGGLYDAATGLVRFGARDYSPEMLRWTARDPAFFGGNQTNLYAYCRNDPINAVDTNGMAPTPSRGMSMDDIDDLKALRSLKARAVSPLLVKLFELSTGLDPYALVFDADIANTLRVVNGARDLVFYSRLCAAGPIVCATIGVVGGSIAMLDIVEGISNMSSAVPPLNQPCTPERWRWMMCRRLPTR